MTGLRVLIIGGNGIISAATSRLAIARGFDVTLLNRGLNTRPVIDGARILRGDASDPVSLSAALGREYFDVVVNFHLFTAVDAHNMLTLFESTAGQFVFISSAAGYQKPVMTVPILESTPLRNDVWQYAQDKIAAEHVLMTAYRTHQFPVTIVRPAHTYDPSLVPLIGGWTMVDRMRRGKPALVQGDGTSFWTLTDSEDVAVGIVGLFGQHAALGEAYHITTSEARSWDYITYEFGRASGVPDPSIRHVSSETIAAALPEWRGPLLGDWQYTEIYDNRKIAAVVPDFAPAVSVSTGIGKIVAWHDADVARRSIDHALDAKIDALIGVAT
jgi:nucleoside-diphosphate-sugar epimerase